jgi:DNA mismatch repair protein MutS
LIRAGKTAALVEQVEDPKTAKGLVRREITRIITPGTVTEEDVLDASSNNYLASRHGLGLAFFDLSTGEFFAEEFDCESALSDALGRYAPAETMSATEENSWMFSYESAYECLLNHFKTSSLDGFGLTGHRDIICAAGALLYYVGTTLRHKIDHVRKLVLRKGDEALVLDAATVRHLQLLPAPGADKGESLLGVLDVSCTPMGARTMRSWALAPLARATEINERLDEVTLFTENRTTLTALRKALGPVRDVERLIAKVDSGRANARDIKALASSLAPIPEISSLLLCVGERMVSGRLINQTDVVSLVEKAIVEEPPALMTSGGYIASGFNSELDELRGLMNKGHQWIAEYQAKEQERTGIAKLKVKYVPAFGYLIEIPKMSAEKAPEDYVRRQTLTTAERFVTPELKTYERDVLGAEEKAVALEAKLFADIIGEISLHSSEIQDNAHALGELDAVMSFADRAIALGYVRPQVDESDVLEIKDGRHPVIEQLPDAEPFVPNSVLLNTTDTQIMLITGPNMAGKSTYIRQVATIAVMAHMGSFVPASFMRIGVLDRIFTRIGAGDDLARGRSTFLVEMQETADILNNATPKSLIVLDEIGRGTSTFDGISIAWSVAEYLHGNSKAKAKTLFATHYHELTDLADVHSGVKNYTVRVKEEGSKVVFLRRIVPGVAEKSFGIHVGAMAGLPKEVIDRATAILSNLEANEIDVNSSQKMVRKPRKKLSEIPGQMTFGFND